MATDADIVAPICQTRAEQGSHLIDQAINISFSKHQSQPDIHNALLTVEGENFLTPSSIVEAHCEGNNNASDVSNVSEGECEQHKMSSKQEGLNDRDQTPDGNLHENTDEKPIDVVEMQKEIVEMEESEESLRVAPENIEASELGEKNNAKCSQEDQSTNASAHEVMEGDAKQKTIDTVETEKDIHENFPTIVPNEKMEETSVIQADCPKMENEDHQEIVTELPYLEQDSTENVVKNEDPRRAELFEEKIAENDLLQEEIQTEKPVESLQALGDIKASNLGQHIERQSLAETSTEVAKDDVSMILLEPESGNECPRKAELENEGNANRMLVKEEAVVENPIDSMQVAPEDINAPNTNHDKNSFIKEKIITTYPHEISSEKIEEKPIEATNSNEDSHEDIGDEDNSPIEENSSENSSLAEATTKKSKDDKLKVAHEASPVEEKILNADPQEISPGRKEDETMTVACSKKENLEGVVINVPSGDDEDNSPIEVDDSRKPSFEEASIGYTRNDESTIINESNFADENIAKADLFENETKIGCADESTDIHELNDKGIDTIKVESENEENTESNSVKEEAQVEKPTDSLQLDFAEIKACDSSQDLNFSIKEGILTAYPQEISSDKTEKESIDAANKSEESLEGIAANVQVNDKEDNSPVEEDDSQKPSLKEVDGNKNEEESTVTPEASFVRQNEKKTECLLVEQEESIESPTLAAQGKETISPEEQSLTTNPQGVIDNTKEDNNSDATGVEEETSEDKNIAKTTSYGQIGENFVVQVDRSGLEQNEVLESDSEKTSLTEALLVDTTESTVVKEEVQVEDHQIESLQEANEDTKTSASCEEASSAEEQILSADLQETSCEEAEKKTIDSAYTEKESFENVPNEKKEDTSVLQVDCPEMENEEHLGKDIELPHLVEVSIENVVKDEEPSRADLFEEKNAENALLKEEMQTEDINAPAPNQDTNSSTEETIITTHPREDIDDEDNSPIEENSSENPSLVEATTKKCEDDELAVVHEAKLVGENEEETPKDKDIAKTTPYEDIEKNLLVQEDCSQVEESDDLEKDSEITSLSECLTVNTESTLDKEPRVEKPIDSLQVVPEDVKTFASCQEASSVEEKFMPANPQEISSDRTEDKTNNTACTKNSVTQADSLETEHKEYLEKDSENSFLTEASAEKNNADKSKDIHELNNKGIDLIKAGSENEENTESTSVKEEAQGEKPIDSLQPDYEEIRAPDSSQDLNISTDEVISTAYPQEVSIVKTEKESIDAANMSEESLEGIAANVQGNNKENNCPVEEDDSQKPSLKEVTGNNNEEESTVTPEARFAGQNEKETACILVEEEESFESSQLVAQDINTSGFGQDKETMSLEEQSLITNHQVVIDDTKEDKTSDATGVEEVTSEDKNIAETTSYEEIGEHLVVQVDRSGLEQNEALESDSEKTSLTEAPTVDTKENMLVKEEVQVKDHHIESFQEANEDTITSASCKAASSTEEQILTADSQEISHGKAEEETSDSAYTEKESFEDNEDNLPIEGDGSEKSSLREASTGDHNDDEPTITQEAKHEDENIVKAHLLQNEKNIECNLVKEEVSGKPLEVENEDIKATASSQDREASHLTEQCLVQNPQGIKGDDKEDKTFDVDELKEEILENKNEYSEKDGENTSLTDARVVETTTSTLVKDEAQVEDCMESFEVTSKDIEAIIPEDIISRNNTVEKTEVENTAEDVLLGDNEDNAPTEEDGSQKPSLEEASTEDAHDHESATMQETDFVEESLKRADLFEKEKTTEGSLSIESPEVPAEDINASSSSEDRAIVTQEDQIPKINPGGLSSEDKTADQMDMQKETPKDEVPIENENTITEAKHIEPKDEECYINAPQMTSAENIAAHPEKEANPVAAEIPYTEEFNVAGHHAEEHKMTSNDKVPEVSSLASEASEQNDDHKVVEEATTCAGKTDMEEIGAQDDGFIVIPTKETLEETDARGSTEAEVQVPDGEKEPELVQKDPETETDQRNIDGELLAEASGDVSDPEGVNDEEEKTKSDNYKKETEIMEDAIRNNEQDNKTQSLLDIKKATERDQEEIASEQEKETPDGNVETTESTAAAIANDFTPISPSESYTADHSIIERKVAQDGEKLHIGKSTLENEPNTSCEQIGENLVVQVDRSGLEQNEILESDNEKISLTEASTVDATENILDREEVQVKDHHIESLQEANKDNKTSASCKETSSTGEQILTADSQEISYDKAEGKTTDSAYTEKESFENEHSGKDGENTPLTEAPIVDTTTSILVNEEALVEDCMESSEVAAEDIKMIAACQETESGSAEERVLVVDTADTSRNNTVEKTEAEDVAEDVPGGDNEDNSPTEEDSSLKPSLEKASTEDDANGHESATTQDAEFVEESLKRADLVEKEKLTEGKFVNEDISIELPKVAAGDIEASSSSEDRETFTQEEQIPHANPGGLTTEDKRIDPTDMQKGTPKDEVAKEIETTYSEATNIEPEEEECYLNAPQMTTAVNIAAHDEKDSNSIAVKIPCTNVDEDVVVHLAEEHTMTSNEKVSDITSLASEASEQNNDHKVVEDENTCGDNDGFVVIPPNETLAEREPTGIRDAEVQVQDGEKQPELEQKDPERETGQRNIDEELLVDAPPEVSESEGLNGEEEKTKSDNCKEVSGSSDAVELDEGSSPDVALEGDSTFNSFQESKRETREEAEKKTLAEDVETTEPTSAAVANDFIPISPSKSYNTDNSITEFQVAQDREELQIGKATFENEEKKINKTKDESSEQKMTDFSPATPDITEARNKDVALLMSEAQEEIFTGKFTKEADDKTIDTTEGKVMKESTSLEGVVNNRSVIDLESKIDDEAPEIIETTLTAKEGQDAEIACETGEQNSEYKSKTQLLESIAHVESCETVSEVEETKAEEKNLQAAAEIKSGEQYEMTYIKENMEDNIPREKNKEDDEDVEDCGRGSCEEEVPKFTEEDNNKAPKDPEENILINEAIIEGLEEKEQVKSVEEAMTSIEIEEAHGLDITYVETGPQDSNEEINRSTVAFSEDKSNRTRADDTDHEMVRNEGTTYQNPNVPEIEAAARELPKGLDENIICEAPPTNTVHETIEDSETKKENSSTIMLQQQEEDSTSKREMPPIPQLAQGKESNKQNQTEEFCRSDEVQAKVEENMMLSARKNEEENKAVTWSKPNEEDDAQDFAEDNENSASKNKSPEEECTESQTSTFSTEIELKEQSSEATGVAAELQEPKAVTDSGSGIPNATAVASQQVEESYDECRVKAESKLQGLPQELNTRDNQDKMVEKDDPVSLQNAMEISETVEVSNTENPKEANADKNTETNNLSLLSDLLQVSKGENPQIKHFSATEKEPTTHTEDLQAEKLKEAAHGDAEKDDEEETNEEKGSELISEAPVMVNMGDADVKVPHKKPHNILSGVGSKVKHSIAKVKKAITGKSSHPKPPSPKKVITSEK